MNTISYFDRMLQPVTEAMSPEFARKLVGFAADSEMLSHVEQLREKPNAGTLTAEEDTSYKDMAAAIANRLPLGYRHRAPDFFALNQLPARLKGVYRLRPAIFSLRASVRLKS